MLRRGQYLPTPLVSLCLGLICLLAIFLRLPNLGGPDFGIDEILHVYAASSLMEGKPPILPSGAEYGRSLPYTAIVAFVGTYFGLNEKTARLPSVVFGMLSVLFVFYMGRSWYSDSVGLIAAFLMAVALEEIFFSRYLRMYSLFQLLYLIVIYTLFEAIEKPPQWSVKKGFLKKPFAWFEKMEVDPILLIICGVLCYFTAFHIHELMGAAMLGPAVYVLGMALFPIFFVTMARERKLKYVFLLLGLILVAIGVHFFFPNYVQSAIRLAGVVPYHAQENAENWKYYRDMLALRYPMMLGTIGLACLYALIRQPKITSYVLLCVLVPVAFQSFVISWKNTRYIFHLLPLLFLLFAVGVSGVLVYLFNALKGWAGSVFRPLESNVIAGGLLIGSILFTVGTTTWFSKSLNVHLANTGFVVGVPHNNWKYAMNFIAQRSLPSDVIVTAWPLLSKYYGPNLPLYVLNDDITTDNRQLDMLGDAKRVSSLKALKDIMSDHDSGWIMTEAYRFKNLERAFPKGVRDFLAQDVERLDVPSAPDMYVWRWK